MAPPANFTLGINIATQDLLTTVPTPVISRAFSSLLAVNTIQYNGYISLGSPPTVFLTNLTTTGILMYARHAGNGDGMLVNSTIAGTARGDVFGPNGVFLYFIPKPFSSAGTVTIQNLSIGTSSGSTQPIELFIGYL